jgi:hypothetical protein
MFAAIRRASSLLSNFAAALPRLILEIDIRQLLPALSITDEAGIQFLDRPRRREAAFRHWCPSNAYTL